LRWESAAPGRAAGGRIGAGAEAGAGRRAAGISAVTAPGGARPGPAPARMRARRPRRRRRGGVAGKTVTLTFRNDKLGQVTGTLVKLPSQLRRKA
jgi:hypothetical protein